MACLRRGGCMEVTMISRGVEISITRGVAETEEVENLATSTLAYRESENLVFIFCS